MTGGAAAAHPARTLPDTRQRFPQWYVSRAAEGWQAVPRATWMVDASTLDGLYERLEREEARREAATAEAATAEAATAEAATAEVGQ